MAQDLAQAVVLKNQPKLEALSTKVNGIHQEILTSAKNTVMRAVEAGKWLIDMKDLLPHGHFEKYVEEHANFSVRTARRYIELNEKWPKIEQELGPDAYISTIDGCLKIVKPPKPNRPSVTDFPPTEVSHDQSENGPEDDDGGTLELDPSIAEAARDIRARREAAERDDGEGHSDAGSGVKPAKKTAKSIEAALEKEFGILTELLEDYHALKPDNLHFDCQQSLDSCYGDFRSWKRKK